MCGAFGWWKISGTRASHSQLVYFTQWLCLRRNDIAGTLAQGSDRETTMQQRVGSEIVAAHSPSPQPWSAVMTTMVSLKL